MTDIYAFGESWAIPAPLRTKLDTVVADWVAANPQSDPSLPGRVSTLESTTSSNTAAIQTKAPLSHTHTIANVTGLDSITKAVNTKVVVATATSFNVDPTGVNDSTAGIRQALAATPAGGTLYFPKGTYIGQAIVPTSEADYIVVDKPVTITGDVGTVLRDVRFYIKGSFDAPVYLGAAATEGDQTITTAAAHGWAPGDYVQVLSQYNAYTEDAGAYQLGSINPTNGTTPVCQVSEIHRVAATPSTTSARFLDLLMYGGYTTSAAPTPIPGVTGAQARRIKPVKGVRITGLTFENRVQGYRCILARGAADLVFEDCSFYSNDNPGFALRIFDTYNLVVRGCRFEKRTDAFTGSSWNSVIVGGGCTDVTFSGCTVTGEAQALDISPNAAVDSVADPGGTLTEYRSTQRIRLLGNTFLNCSDGATTHPGTMDVLIAGNHVTGGSTGFRVRSRRAQILSNNIQTSRRGVALSAFVTQTLIYGNHFLQITSSKYTGFYAGVEYSASSSEIISDNRAQVDIIGNAFTVSKVAGAANYAVITNYSEPSSSSVTLTDEWRNRKSDIVVANNSIRNGTVLTAHVTHGCKVIGNQFSGGTTLTHYVMLQGTASVVHNNIFDDYTGHIRCYATPRSGSTYTHPVENQIGSNATTGAALNYTLANSKTMTVKVGV